MADDAKTRKARSRAHSRGDHSLCNPARCDGRDVTPRDRDTGRVEASTRAFAEGLNFAENDPRAAMVALAIQMARAADAGNASAAAQLRQVFDWILEFPNDPADAIDEIRARGLAQRVRLLIGDG